MPGWVTDLFSNFWVSLGGKLLLVALMIPLVGMVIGFAEMKLSAKMQYRVGPYFAGGRWGWAQLIADGVKFFQKEDIIPTDADRPVFKSAPMLVLVGTVALFVVIPFGPNVIFRDLDVGVFYVLAISSLVHHRGPDGGLVIGEQVLVDRWVAGRRPAHRLRAAPGPGGGRAR